ncbi:MAG: DNA repair protein RecN [Bacteroidales bacterium]|nr:DNA repair protein RecN [Bacteroidales bacterium]
MIKSLSITNYALIASLEIEFEGGLSVITGETGAGKSILLGALSLLLGQRADAKSIRQGAPKCVVEATFEIQGNSLDGFFEDQELEIIDGECVIRREVQANGKSRAFINDTPVSLAVLKELTDQLIDIHSQHRNLFLADSLFQLNVVDIVAAHPETLASYARAFKEFTEAGKVLAELLSMAEKSNEENDYLTFQFNQLDEAKLQSGELELLEEEQIMLSHAEEIKSALFGVDELFSGEGFNVLSSLHEIVRSIQNVESFQPNVKEQRDRLESNLIDLKDIASELRSIQEKVEYNPERLLFINDRLDTIYSLMKKHKVDSVDELVALHKDLGKQLEKFYSLEQEIVDANKQLEKARKALATIATQLTEERKQSVPRIEKQLVETLLQLGMPHVRLKVELTAHEPDKTGADTVSFLFSANKNAPLQPIGDIASGGEVARVMLSLKALIAGAISLPTIIFDEIDTGVSGEMAGKMATIMQQMGKTMQVIAITHLPQIAAKGSTHYHVYKEDTELDTITHIRTLDSDERVREIAQMLSDGVISEAAINNAHSLLDNK